MPARFVIGVDHRLAFFARFFRGLGKGVGDNHPDQVSDERPKDKPNQRNDDPTHEEYSRTDEMAKTGE
jgi:hypothetical protein